MLGRMADVAVTRVLEAIDAGDPRASGELLPLVYAELRKLAEDIIKAQDTEIAFMKGWLAKRKP